MEKRKQHRRIEGEQDLNRLFGFEVVGNDGNSIGKVDNIWMDETRQPAFFGIQTGWLFGQIHVVPAHRSEVNFQKRNIRLPYSEEKVKGAPSYDPSVDLTPEQEHEVYRYYNIESSQAEARQTRARETEARRPRAERGTDEQTVQLNEEQVEVGKRDVGTGGVRLRKVIRTERVNEPVELKHEDIEIERVPADQARKGPPADLQEEEIYIPLRQEEAVVHKETKPTEQVHVSKKTKTEKKDISETRRKEDLEIERAEDERKYGT